MRMNKRGRIGLEDIGREGKEIKGLINVAKKEKKERTGIKNETKSIRKKLNCRNTTKQRESTKKR